MLDFACSSIDIESGKPAAIHKTNIRQLEAVLENTHALQTNSISHRPQTIIPSPPLAFNPVCGDVPLSTADQERRRDISNCHQAVFHSHWSEIALIL